MRSSIRKLGFLLLPLLISACAGGGGGGGGSSGGVVVTPFTSWSAIQPNTTVQATGGLSSYFAFNSSGVDAVATATTTASFTGSYGAVQSDGYIYLDSATISAGSGGPSVTFSKAAGDTIDEIAIGPLAGIVTGMIKADESAVALSAEPQVLGWNYQTFGIWITGDTSGFAGAVSVGSPTAVTGIPATGSGTFSGSAAGFYISPSNVNYFTAADMSAVTNFSTRSVTFNTNNTALSTNLTNFQTPAFYAIGGNLNVSGALSYAAGTNSISGAVAATGVNIMSGTANAKFYGPNAQEIGGTYALSRSGTTERLFGGFGGKR
jgi:hypothetical protein